MNSNTSEESPTISDVTRTLQTQPQQPQALRAMQAQTVPVSIPLSSPLVESLNIPSVLEPTMNPVMSSTSIPTGENVSVSVSNSSETISSPMHEKPIDKPSTNLKSRVTAAELLDAPPPDPRILRISPADLDALARVIQEWSEQSL